MQVKKQQLELDMEQWTGSALEKEYSIHGIFQARVLEWGASAFSRKGIQQGGILSLCLFNLYAGYIMQNVGLDESQAGIKIAKRNINNVRYADDTTLMAESEEELKSLLMKVKEESEKAGLKLNVLVCIPTNSVRGFPFLHTLSSIYYL